MRSAIARALRIPKEKCQLPHREPLSTSRTDWRSTLATLYLGALRQGPQQTLNSPCIEGARFHPLLLCDHCSVVVGFKGRPGNMNLVDIAPRPHLKLD